MSIDFLTTVLNNIDNPGRENRKTAANIVLQQPNLLKNLVALTFEVNNKLSIKAAWVLEWICTHHGINHLLPYLDYFTKNVHTVSLDSAVRPCAKICEHLAKAYTSKKSNETKLKLTKKHIDYIIEAGFDWLITDQKIAVKAYTMETLFLFGKNTDWILEELESIITNNVIHESKGCEARGKKILHLINKQKNKI